MYAQPDGDRHSLVLAGQSSAPIGDGWRLIEASDSRTFSGESPLESTRYSAIAADVSAGRAYAATVPAQVHDVLLEHGEITDPREYRAAERCTWVSERDWIYVVEFERPVSSRTTLKAFGVDTIADVFLNGRHLGGHSNMYVPFEREISRLLADANELVIYFYSPYAYLRRQAPENGRNPFYPVHRILHKPNGDFINFNGAQPYLTPIGLFDDVILVGHAQGDIGALDLEASVLPPYDVGTLTVSASGMVPEGADAEVDCELTLLDESRVARSTTHAAAAVSGNWSVTTAITVESPKLWNPIGYGQPNRYELVLTLRVGGDVRARIARRIGFRHLEIDGRLDLRVNGRSVKLWGANLTSPEGMTHVWRSDRAIRLLDLAEQCNMNSLRVWGPGGPYAEELFDEADRRGILLWAEMPFNWGMYPDNERYRAGVVQLAEHMVATLKHHPSIFLWCGGNESIMGAEVDHPGGRCVGRELFESDIRGVCSRIDPQRFYLMNSPSGGHYANDPRFGDSHSYTHQWFVPGQNYPVMFTENTRISTARLKTMRRVLGPERLWPEGFPGVQKPISTDELQRETAYRFLPDTWMPLTLGREALLGRMGRFSDFFPSDRSPEGLIRLYGAAHSSFIETEVEAYRRGRPHHEHHLPRRTMGHYLWKLNNALPMIYSNVIDYFLEPTIAYYALKRAYSPTLLTFEVADSIYLWCVNDTATDIRGTLVFEMRDQTGCDVLHQLETPVTVRSGDAIIVADIGAFGMFQRSNLLSAELVDGPDIIAQKTATIDRERNLRFPDARLKLVAAGGGIEVSTDQFARSVELAGSLDGDEFGFDFSDNFFDLLPGKTKRVEVLGPKRRGVVTARPFFSSATASVTI